jgi:hypothetical protein
MGASADYRVWGEDLAIYGPVELPTLVAWIKDDRVTAETWLFVGQNNAWHKASEVPELQMFFKGPRQPAIPLEPVSQSVRGISPGALRRIKALATLSDEQLNRFAQFVEVEKFPQWSVVVKKDDPGNTMFFILEGELRARLSDPSGRERILATFGAGDFFGEISLFDHGPRSADVVANTDAMVASISASDLDELSREAPDLAAHFLRAIGRTISARIRADNKRLSQTLAQNGLVR